LGSSQPDPVFATCHNVLFRESFLASLDVPLTLLARATSAGAR
jgi:hypothetical protein